MTMSKRKRPGSRWHAPRPKEHINNNASDLTPSSNGSLAVAPPTELSRRVDTELDADRNFFKQWPERQHYIRRIFPYERAQFEFHRQGEAPVFDPLTHALFIAVKKVLPKARVRVGFIAPRDIETDLSEAEAEQVFGWASSS